MGDLISDLYDDAVAEAERIRREADARFEAATAWPLQELEAAKARYWHAVAPAQEALDAAYYRAGELETKGYQDMLTAHRESEKRFAMFVADLLSSTTEEEVTEKLKAKAIEEGMDVSSVE